MVTSSKLPRRYSFAEYLEIEARSEIKYEYFDGQVFAMSGGTPEHSRIASNIILALGRRLEGRRCVAFTSDLRVRILATGLATHPDVTVVCGKLERDPEDPNGVVNPTVIVEVLSPGTEGYDRNQKFAHYRMIPSLQAYVLVSQERRHVEVLTRNPDATWTLRDVMEGAAALAAIGCELPLDEIYRDPLKEEPTG